MEPAKICPKFKAMSKQYNKMMEDILDHTDKCHTCDRESIQYSFLTPRGKIQQAFNKGTVYGLRLAKEHVDSVFEKHEEPMKND